MNRGAHDTPERVERLFAVDRNMMNAIAASHIPTRAKVYEALVDLARK
jgi:hypothetical protein